jgi:TrmH family RNA methyltransferase
MIRFVLVDTSHPGNIGAVARAMKNMGLSELVLVRPVAFPHAEATARASGADDLLQTARICDTVAEAVVGCGLVLATTSREREHYHRLLDVREAAAMAIGAATSAPVALLFGTERTGLTNQDLAIAHALLRIPTSDNYASLNLAMAAQIVAYEILRAQGTTVKPMARETVLAAPEDLERLYVHLEAVLEEINFRDRTASGQHLMSRIRRLLQRAEPDLNEVNILRGILTAVQNSRRRAGAARS